MKTKLVITATAFSILLSQFSAYARTPEKGGAVDGEARIPYVMESSKGKLESLQSAQKLINDLLEKNRLDELFTAELDVSRWMERHDLWIAHYQKRDDWTTALPSTRRGFRQLKANHEYSKQVGARFLAEVQSEIARRKAMIGSWKILSYLTAFERGLAMQVNRLKKTRAAIRELKYGDDLNAKALCDSYDILSSDIDASLAKLEEVKQSPEFESVQVEISAWKPMVTPEEAQYEAWSEY